MSFAVEAYRGRLRIAPFCQVDTGKHAMGLSYRNIMVQGPTQQDIVVFLMQQDGHHVVSPTAGDITAVYLYPERLASQSEARLDDGVELYQLPMTFISLVVDLSRELKCVVLGIDVADDDIFRYLLVTRGVMEDYYVSPAIYLVPETADLPWEQVMIDYVRPPQGGNAELLCKVFGVPSNSTKVAAILNENELESQYAFQSDRYHDLAAALGFPNFAHLEWGGTSGKPTFIVL